MAEWGDMNAEVEGRGGMGGRGWGGDKGLNEGRLRMLSNVAVGDLRC